MSTFSAVSAATFGFGLPRRDPLTFIGVVLLMTALSVVMGLVMLPAYADLMEVTLRAPDDANAVMAANMTFLGAVGWTYLLAIFAWIVV